MKKKVCMFAFFGSKCFRFIWKSQKIPFERVTKRILLLKYRKEIPQKIFDKKVLDVSENVWLWDLWIFNILFIRVEMWFLRGLMTCVPLKFTTNENCEKFDKKI